MNSLETELTFTRFERMCQKYPDRPAVIYMGETCSYSRLKDLIDRFATSLTRFGIGKGDKVMIYISNSVQWVITFFGIQKIGAVAIPVPPIYTSFEIEYMINNSGAETIVCLDTNFCYVKEVFPKTWPLIFNLRRDPYERATITSNTYYDWLLDRAFLLVPAQAYVAQFLATFKEFPPRQKAASFSLDQVMEKMKSPGGTQ